MKFMKTNSFLIAILISLVLSACDTGTTRSENTPENGDLDNTFTPEGEVNMNDPEQELQRFKDSLMAEGWLEQEQANGQLPKCYNFIPQNANIDNSLEVQVGNGTDVAIKVMDVESDVCVRFVFINRGTSYSIKNIPEGRYYLKIAYGKDWLSKVEGDRCVGKFIRNPMYEKGEDMLDFHIQHSADGYSIPSFILKLDVISNDIASSFNSHNITENAFNQ